MGGLDGQTPSNVRRPPYWLGAAALALGLAAGCAGSRLEGQTYRGSGFRFRVGPVARDWRPIESSQSLVAFRADRDKATVALDGRCGKDGDDVPLTALTRHLFLYFTDRKVLSERTFSLDGRAALRTEMEAELDGVPKRFTVVVLKKDGCVYDFIYVEDVPGSREGRAQFDQFVAGFSTPG
jgi:hypothetical protein